jgi:teichuronic acid biosynthesis glycosyltransferase TuaG
MTGNNPLVTVIIPLYNAEKYIVETIESVMNQTYQNWELLVIDDCSTDNSRSLVEKFEKEDSRIRLIESETNFGGPARPRNIGIDNAKGEYIAFLDADDVWTNSKLKKQIEIIHNTNYDIIYTLANTIDTNSNIIGEFKNQNIYNKLKYFYSDLTILYFSNYININTVLMKKDLNIKFRENKNLIALEDWMFWIENLYNNKKIKFISEPLINYRIDINSISDRGSDKSYRKAYILYSILFFEKKISFSKFLISFILNSFRILLKNIQSK